MASPCKNKVTHRAYTLEFKLSVVDWIRKHGSSTRAASKRFGIHRKMVRTWLEKEDALQTALVSVGPQRRRLRAGRKPLSLDLDHRLLAWLEEQRERQVAVMDRQLQQKALDIAAELGLADYKASCMWLRRWKRRHNVVFRDGTNQVVSIEEVKPLHTIPVLSGESILSYTDRHEKIRLVCEEEDEGEEGFPDLSSSPVLEEYYYDYSTPEHNYCAVQELFSPTDSMGNPHLTSDLDISSLVGCEVLGLPLTDTAPLPGHEEVVGEEEEEEESSCCVIVAASSKTRRGAAVSKNATCITAADSNSIGVANRLSQPVFHLGPEIVYVDLPSSSSSSSSSR